MSSSRVPGFGAVCAAICAHGAAAAELCTAPLAAAAFSGTGSAVIAWQSGAYRVRTAGETNRSAEVRRAALALICGFVFTLLSLLPSLSLGAGEGAGSGATAATPGKRAGPDALGGLYRGVILLPERAPHAVLVPPLPFLRHDLFSNPRSNPLSVPFDGVYWIFRFPNRQPPPHSFRIRGSPLTSGFRSSDQFPLSMEARQNFGALIDLNCCRQIQLAVRDADNTFVTLELIVQNTTLPGSPPLSLGRQSASPAAGAASAADTVLSYDVPQLGRKLREFDAATIAYRRGFGASSARLAIDRFIFIPRGY